MVTESAISLSRVFREQTKQFVLIGQHWEPAGECRGSNRDGGILNCVSRVCLLLVDLIFSDWEVARGGLTVTRGAGIGLR